MKVAAVIPAAGTGTRMGGGLPKQFHILAGLPILVHTLKIFEIASEVHDVFLIVPPDHEEKCRRECIEPYGIRKVTRILPGGFHRQDSVYAGILATPPDTDIILVHDGVRPFVTRSMIRRSIEGAVQHSGAIAAITVKDTPKMADAHGQITDSLERSSLWLAQTPQAFQRSVLIEAYQRAYTDGIYHTDDSALVERLGYHVQIITGAWYNLKITQQEDFYLAEQILKMRQESFVED